MNLQQNVTQTIQKIPETIQKIPAAINATGESIGNAIQSAKAGVNNVVSGFSQKAQGGVNAGTQFLSANTIIAKFAFLLFVIIIFVLLIAVGITMISYFTSPKSSPFIVKGMVSGSDPGIDTVNQNPVDPSSITILRSNNESTGLEFTWSLWLYLSDLGSSSQFQHVFSKGDSIPTQSSATGIAAVNNAPGVYLTPGKTASGLDASTSNLHIIMDTVIPQQSGNSIDITNVPIKKWFHIAIRIENMVMDIYVNGVISGRIIFDNVPKQNYDNVNVCNNNGFKGNLSNLQYFNRALNVFEINKIVTKGPDTKTSSQAASNLNNFSYLSNMWYSSKL